MTFEPKRSPIPIRLTTEQDIEVTYESGTARECSIVAFRPVIEGVLEWSDEGGAIIRVEAITGRSRESKDGELHYGTFKLDTGSES